MLFCTSTYEPVDFSRLLGNTPAAFLVCGGPSTLEKKLSVLGRGVFTLAVNNAAADRRFKPSAFISQDPPEKFHMSIWSDPGIMKFVPKTKLKPGRSVLRVKEDDGFRKVKMSARDMPNVWGYEKRSWFLPDDSFFTEEVSLGNYNIGVRRTGLEKCACTMLAGIRVLYELGARRIYLLGVDFDMTSGYSFKQARDQDAIDSNNHQYSILNSWLTTMTKDDVWSRAGVEIYNCNPHSKLEAFESVEFYDAVDFALTNYPEHPFDTFGWYEKETKD